MAALFMKDTKKGLKGVSAMLATVMAGGTLGTTARSIRFEDIAIDLRSGREAARAEHTHVWGGLRAVVRGEHRVMGTGGPLGGLPSLRAQLPLPVRAVRALHQEAGFSAGALGMG